MRYVQYGCGLCAPKEWVNYDISPTLRIRKIPIIGKLITKVFNHEMDFSENIICGDIVKGLGEIHDTVDVVYCSHILEHLALEDLRNALRNTYTMLKPGGVFRFVLPDLEYMARTYIANVDRHDSDSAIKFMESSLLGVTKREHGVRAFTINFLGNSHHLWMWDYYSLAAELSNIGFKNIRRCQFNDNPDSMFKLVESAERFTNCLAMEAIK
jgi:SAM-dependent methyltransferase